MNTLYENAEGEFVTDNAESSHLQSPNNYQPQQARHCCVFQPEEFVRQHPSHTAFRPCQQTSHAAVFQGFSTQLHQQRQGQLQKWGKLSALMSNVLAQRGVAGRISFEYSVVEWFLHLLQNLRSIFPQWCPARQTTRPIPTICWHPHKNVFATLSCKGTIAVHSFGDALTGSTTQHIQDDASLGYPTCLAWQPNDVRGVLAVGFSTGVAVWRCSCNEGWQCCWTMKGLAFACPALAWSLDGRCLAAAGPHGVVRIWPLSSVMSDLLTEWSVTLRRWGTTDVSSIRWCPDGTYLAVIHGGAHPMIYLWDTRTWEVTIRIPMSAGSHMSQARPTVDWCSNETLLGSAGGRLFEMCGLGASGGWAAGFEPTFRTLPVPHISLPFVTTVNDSERQQVLEVAVCPRTAQRIAVRLENVTHVLVFERLGTEGWLKQDLALRGLICATRCSHPSSTNLIGHSDDLADMQPTPCAVAFACNSSQSCQWDSTSEGSLLAVYWNFGASGAEVRTYPLHFLPYKLLQSDSRIMYD